MLQNVKDHLRGVEARSEDVKNAILDDIRVIASNSLDRDTWTTVLALFKTKWETAEFEERPAELCQGGSRCSSPTSSRVGCSTRTRR